MEEATRFWTFQNNYLQRLPRPQTPKVPCLRKSEKSNMRRGTNRKALKTRVTSKLETKVFHLCSQKENKETLQGEKIRFPKTLETRTPTPTNNLFTIMISTTDNMTTPFTTPRRNNYGNEEEEAIQYVNAAMASTMGNGGRASTQLQVGSGGNKAAASDIINRCQFSNLSALRLPFPLKLYQMLDDADRQGYDDIVSWLPEGNGFIIYNPKELTNTVLPAYFRQTKYTSFTRQVRTLACDGTNRV